MVRGMAVLARDEATGEAKEIINYPALAPSRGRVLGAVPIWTHFPSIAVT
jgi:hypothetical protein